MLVTRPFFRIEFLVILALQVPRPPRVILVKNEVYKKKHSRPATCGMSVTESYITFLKGLHEKGTEMNKTTRVACATCQVIPLYRTQRYHTGIHW